jgi:hypothetical protein
MPAVWVCGSASLLHAAESERDDYAKPGVPALWEESSHEREGDRTMNNYGLVKLLRDAADALEKAQKVLDSVNVGRPLKSLQDFDKLPTGVKNVLIGWSPEEEINYVEQLTSMSEGQLRDRRQCGDVAIKCIRNFLAVNGLHLRLDE